MKNVTSRFQGPEPDPLRGRAPGLRVSRAGVFTLCVPRNRSQCPCKVRAARWPWVSTWLLLDFQLTVGV